MSYSNQLWDNSEMVIRQSNFQLGLVQDFITSVSHRIQIEFNYSNQLKLLSSNLDKLISKEYPDRNYIIFALSAFKSDVVRRQNQTSVFMNHLKEQVLNKTKLFYDEQLLESKRLQKQIAIIQNGYKEIRKKMDNAKIKLSQLDKERQFEFMKLQISKIMISMTKQEKQKRVSKASLIQKQYKEYDVIYRGTMKEYNNYIQQFLDSIEYYMKTLQSYEEDRVGKMIDNIKKIMVFQSAMMRNFQYDLLNIITQLNNLEHGKDINEFIQKYSKKNPKPHQQNIPKLNMRSTVIYEMLIKKFQDKVEFQKSQIKKFSKGNFIKFNKIDKQKQKGIVEYQNNQIDKYKATNNNIQQIKESEFRQIIELLHYSNQEVENATQSKLKDIFDKQDNRNFSQLYIRHKCEQNNYDTSQYISNTIKLLFEKCIIKKDIFCIRRILNLIFTQCSIKTFKNKQIIYYSLLNHPLWGSHDFWQASIFQSIQQKLKFYPTQKKQKRQDTKQRQKLFIQNELADHCNMMVMLGYNNKSLKLLAGEQQSKHLLTIIRESLDVYDDVFKDSSSKTSQTSQSQIKGDSKDTK